MRIYRIDDYHGLCGAFHHQGIIGRKRRNVIGIVPSASDDVAVGVFDAEDPDGFGNLQVAAVIYQHPTPRSHFVDYDVNAFQQTFRRRCQGRHQSGISVGVGILLAQRISVLVVFLVDGGTDNIDVLVTNDVVRGHIQERQSHRHILFVCEFRAYQANLDRHGRNTAADIRRIVDICGLPFQFGVKAVFAARSVQYFGSIRIIGTHDRLRLIDEYRIQGICHEYDAAGGSRTKAQIHFGNGDLLALIPGARPYDQFSARFVAQGIIADSRAVQGIPDSLFVKVQPVGVIGAKRNSFVDYCGRIQLFGHERHANGRCRADGFQRSRRGIYCKASDAEAYSVVIDCRQPRGIDDKPQRFAFHYLVFDIAVRTYYGSVNGSHRPRLDIYLNIYGLTALRRIDVSGYRHISAGGAVHGACGGDVFVGKVPNYPALYFA